MSLAGKTVLVTGATGFIGGRLVEVLHRQHGCRVRGLVHNFTNASRLSRLPVRMIGGDVSDLAALTAAAAGCDVIIHAAMGTGPNAAARRRDTVSGSEVVMKAARAAGVGRVVHFSTISVYGITPDGDLCETSPRGALVDDYSRNKSDAERCVLDFHRSSGLPVAVIQPTVVYGPFAGWSSGPIGELRSHRVVVPNNGDGLCNPVYLDDVVDATILASWHPAAVGECFLISGDSPVTWKEFYGAYEAMLGYSATVGMTYKEYIRTRRSTPPLRELKTDLITLARHPSALRWRQSRRLVVRVSIAVARALLPRRWWKGPAGKKYPPPAPVKPEKLLFLPDEARFRWQATRTRVRIDKAKAVLGYRPRYDFDRGMAITKRWAEWANLLRNDPV